MLQAKIKSMSVLVWLCYAFFSAGSVFAEEEVFYLDPMIVTAYRYDADDGKPGYYKMDEQKLETGNYENALIRFETRIGSPMLSDVIRGLIGVLRGDDQRMYFKMITFDMRQIEQNNLKKEAAKRPKKIQRYSMMMLICIMIIYLVVLCTEVMSSLGAFFG